MAASNPLESGGKLTPIFLPDQELSLHHGCNNPDHQHLDDILAILTKQRGLVSYSWGSTTQRAQLKKSCKVGIVLLRLQHPKSCSMNYLTPPTDASLHQIETLISILTRPCLYGCGCWVGISTVDCATCSSVMGFRLARIVILFNFSISNVCFEWVQLPSINN